MVSYRLTMRLRLLAFLAKLAVMFYVVVEAAGGLKAVLGGG